MRVVGVGGDPAKQSHAVECDALAGEDEQEGEEGGAGVAVVEGVEEADVEEGACGPGGQREGPGGVLGALGEAGFAAGAGVRGDAVAFSSTPTSPRWRRTSPDRADDNPLTACRSPYQHRARDTFWDQGDDFQGSDLVRGVGLPRGRASSRCPALRASTSTRRGGPCGARRAAPGGEDVGEYRLGQDFSAKKASTPKPIVSRTPPLLFLEGGGAAVSPPYPPRRAGAEMCPRVLLRARSHRLPSRAEGAHDGGGIEP